MGKAVEDVVVTFLETFHDPDGTDLDRILSFFAKDGYYQVLVPTTERTQGHAAIRAALEKQFKSYSDCICEIHAIASNDHQVFTERSDHVTLLPDGRKVASRVCAIFELDDARKITAWREYWDTGDVLRKMGIDQSVLDSYIK